MLCITLIDLKMSKKVSNNNSFSFFSGLLLFLFGLLLFFRPETSIQILSIFIILYAFSCGFYYYKFKKNKTNLDYVLMVLGSVVGLFLFF